MRRPEWCQRLAVLLGYVVIALVFTWPLPMRLGTHLTGDPASDTGVYVWNQWVFRHEALVAHANPFSTGRILSLTSRVDLGQHNYTVFLDLLALPFQPWLGVVATFNLVFLAVTVLNAVLLYALARAVTDASRLEAWTAGLAFGWSPILVARGAAHFSLVAAAALPAFVLCLVRADRSRRPRDAALAGLCMAWAGLSDAYYAVFCLIIGIGYLGMRAVRVRLQPGAPRLSGLWVLDLGVVLVAGLIVGLLAGRGLDFRLLGASVRVHGLYTPVLLLTVLVALRVLVQLRPVIRPARFSPAIIVPLLVAVLACAGPLAPVLYSLGTSVTEGQFVNPPILWRSSPRGVDLLALVEPNPLHPLVRALRGHAESLSSVTFVEYTASVGLVALAIVLLAMAVAKYRPRPAWILLPTAFGLLALGPFVHVLGFNTHVPGPWALLRYVPLLSVVHTPTRFAVVASLGVAVLLAGALAALGRRYPARRTAMALAAIALLLVELWPGPRPLFAADIPRIFAIVRDDPRPVRVLELPFGVRDGVSSAGNFSARSQFHQTLHGKRLIGGYLSRISRRRVETMRRDFPIVGTLVTLSEGAQVPPARYAEAAARGEAFVRRAELGWVVIDEALVSPTLARFARDAFRLTFVARDGSRALYRTDY